MSFCFARGHLGVLKAPYLWFACMSALAAEIRRRFKAAIKVPHTAPPQGSKQNTVTTVPVCTTGGGGLVEEELRGSHLSGETYPSCC